MNAAEKLLACPFCGSSARRVEYRGQIGIRCSGMCGMSHYSLPEVAWNLRTPPPPPQTEAREWRPIETAPKDGTWILGINNRGNCAVIIWSYDAIDRGRVIPGWIHPFSDGRLSVFWNGACGSVATHWMPLPEPPK